MGGRLVFKVMDEDTVCDEVVGSINVDAAEYIIDDIVNVADKDGKVIWSHVALDFKTRPAIDQLLQVIGDLLKISKCKNGPYTA